MKLSLSPKQQRFCEEYLVDLNATQAAVRAGYSKKTAGQIGFEQLRKPDVQAHINTLRAEQSKRTQVNADYVIKNFQEIVERCMQRSPVMIRVGSETVHAVDEEGRHVWRFDAMGANTANTKLGEILGLFNKKDDTPPEDRPLAELSDRELLALALVTPKGHGK